MKIIDKKKYESIIKKENLGVTLEQELDISRTVVRKKLDWVLKLGS